MANRAVAVMNQVVFTSLDYSVEEAGTVCCGQNYGTFFCNVKSVMLPGMWTRGSLAREFQQGSKGSIGLELGAVCGILWLKIWLHSAHVLKNFMKLN